jgi:hypothetical protein
MSWRSAWTQGGVRAPISSTPTPAATARYGAWASVTTRVLADRVAIRGIVGRLPAAERRAVQGVLPLVDRMVAEVANAAEQLIVLEGAAGAGDERDERAKRRRELSDRLDRAAGAIASVRRALRSADAEGVMRMRSELETLAGAGLSAPAAGSQGDREGQESRDRRE